MNRFLTFVATLAFVALLAAPAQAQEGEARFGLQGGISLSKFTGNDAPDDQSNKSGFLAGVTFDYFFSKNIGLGVEGNWLGGLGAKEGSGSSGDAEIKASYFSFPVTVTAAFGLGEQEKTFIGLEAGIAPNLNLTCSTSIVGSAGDVDCKDDTKSVMWSLPLGAGVGFMMSDAAVVSLKARYQLGLSSVAEDSSDDIKLNWWEFILGVTFVP